jgi:uncharacterized protein Yka (UPF0111/DUF47 family)
MFSLQRILGHDKKFFDLLDSSACEAQASIVALEHLMKSPATPTLEEFVAARRKDKRITNEITSLLCRTFVTALEREDIEDLATALYKIPKTIEKFAERYVITREQIKDVDFTRQVGMLQQATNTLPQMLKQLRESNLKGLVELSGKLQKIEADGDQLLCELTGQLYAGQHDPLKALILKDLYELLEKVLDRCRSAGNVMARVALKHT